MPLKPDLVASVWIKAVRTALGMSQPKFAEEIGAADRDAVAKWEGGSRSNPGFTYTRRIVTIAPPELVRTFVGQTLALNGERRLSPTEPTVGGAVAKMKTEAQYIADRLNAIEDDAVRIAAMEKCSKAIREALLEATEQQRLPSSPATGSERATPRGRHSSSR